MPLFSPTGSFHPQPQIKLSFCQHFASLSHWGKKPTSKQKIKYQNESWRGSKINRQRERDCWIMVLAGDGGWGGLSNSGWCQSFMIIDGKRVWVCAHLQCLTDSLLYILLEEEEFLNMLALFWVYIYKCWMFGWSLGMNLFWGRWKAFTNALLTLVFPSDLLTFLRYTMKRTG